MVGGIVIEVVDTKDGSTFIDCRDRTYHRDTCAIYVKTDEKSRRVQIGDALWWQGSKAFWTPAHNRLSEKESKRRGHKCGVDYEIVLHRIGYSGVKLPNRPTGKEA